ncbi:MAG: CBS domain-containing protein [Candidatus Omnitrophota bacterium]|jgi:CBS domain-containing protein
MKKLVKVQQKANTPFALKINDSIIKTSENTSVREIAKILKQNKIGAIIVERNGDLAGIISERDVVWRVVAEDKSLDETKAKDIMTSDVVSVDLDDGIDKIYEMMKKVPFGIFRCVRAIRLSVWSQAGILCICVILKLLTRHRKFLYTISACIRRSSDHGY